ncbi:hypothetical protein [Herbiconiux sp. L3-i23]|uniref:hypothetical protein n=1 Tax=Herbiconiux sp. L3-i23 TaxID=2905871 RepID=UPI00205B870D|nr:hypothetical protein [Herbiconiux sp. L3-i23]BDI23525.1 hypothetical protein L3i23_23010 [Herbiconiux sp. L3-i23]
MFPSARYRRFRRDERALLDALLDSQESGFDRLRAQLATASYKAPWFPGSMSFEIHVADGPRYAAADPVPEGEGLIVRAQQVYQPGAEKTDAAVIGNVFLWVTDGIITGLEYAAATDRPPTSLPEPSQLGD